MSNGAQLKPISLSNYNKNLYKYSVIILNKMAISDFPIQSFYIIVLTLVPYQQGAIAKLRNSGGLVGSLKALQNVTWVDGCELNVT